MRCSATRRSSFREQWDRACDYLDDDIASGYVRVLQELIAASWADARGRQGGPRRPAWDGSISSSRSRARPSAELGGLGPLTPEEIGAFAANAFIGAESLYLLGVEKKGVAGASGAAARRRSHSYRGRLLIGEMISCAQRCPAKEGFVERDGVKLHYEIYGDGPETMVFVPPWSIVHSRIYKAQLPYFSERFRCIAYDGRGNGKSDRPTEAAAYSLDNYVADVLAVMDATEAGKAILVGLSFGGMHRLRARRASSRTGQGGDPGRHGREHRPGLSVSAPQAFLAKHEQFEGWNKFNRDYWLANYPDFAEHFIRNIHSEPHSTRQIEDGIEWASETSGPVLIKTVEARTIPPEFDVSEAMYRKIGCPVLVIHGDNDQIQPMRARRPWPRSTGAELVTIPGGGHNPLGRYSGKVQCADRRFPRSQARHRRAAESGASRTSKAKKALYLSSPIGLGHGRRDIAITRELRKLHPDLQVDWLAQDPVTRLLEASGERVHPLSARLASESRHIELESGEHDLHCFQAIRRMDEVLIANFMIFQDAVEEGDYDLVIADEAWDIDHYWHEHPELKKAKLAWFTDFVGYVPMPSGGEHEAF